MEIGAIQNKNPEALTEALLIEIDDMFQEAEHYFKSKQQALNQRHLSFKQQRDAMNLAKSKINTNLNQKAAQKLQAEKTERPAIASDCIQEETEAADEDFDGQ